MPLAAPPIQVNPPVAAFLAPDQLWDAAAMVGPMVFACTTLGSRFVYRWTNPTDIASYSRAALAGTGINPPSMVYDSVQKTLYGCSAPYSFSPTLIDIFTVNPVTLASSLLTTLSDSGDVAGANCAVTTDGTYLYFLDNAVGANSTIYKVRLSDGVQIGTYTLTTSNTGRGSVIAYDPATGFLLAAGGAVGNTWAAKIPISIDSETVVRVTEISFVNDDSYLLSGFWWLTNERIAAANRDVIVKMSTADLSYAVFSSGQGVAHDGIAYDGSRLWFASSLSITDPPSSSPVTAINPATGAAVLTCNAPAQGLNEMFWTGAGLFLYNSLFGVPGQSTIMFVPVPGAVNLNEIEGRGAC